VKVVDTTGGGDVFHGAYAFGLARDMELAERIRFAAATAALKVMQPGGQSGIPSLPEVRAFLKQ
jgi:sulfofructose kinase